MLDPATIPNFFIVGAAKAGTTTLYELLKRHPDVYLSVIKEPQFFCCEDLYQKGIDYYLKTYFNKSSKFSARGDATPQYIHFEKVAKRISEAIPTANQRFILIMRDPVKRAYSLYWNMVAEGVENLSFKDAIEQEDIRSRDPYLEKNCALKFQYIKSGMYAHQIRNYLKYFKKDQFLFLFFEDLIENKDKVFNEICGFLGIRSDVLLSTEEVFNASSMPRSRLVHRFIRQPSFLKSKIAKLLPVALRYRIVSHVLEINKKKGSYEDLDKVVELRLREIFKDDIIDLQTITGRTLSNWLSTK